MAYSYLPVDRDQLFLLPASMREWLPEDHLAWFVIDVVDRVDTSAFDALHPNDGAGRPAYDPKMLLALLLYAYAEGMFSSRRIERLCRSDVAYRVICANHSPDHTAIARFRADHEQAVKGVFIDVLVLCAAAGVTSLGTIAIDGTKIAAAASLRANRARGAVRAELERLRAAIDVLLAEAMSADAAEDRVFGQARGDELPPELADPRSRARRLEQALAELAAMDAAAPAPKGAPKAEEMARAGRRVAGRRPKGAHAALARAEADLEAVRTNIEAARAAREARRTAAGNYVGRPPTREAGRLEAAQRRLDEARAAAERATTEARVNVTDPQSRVMPSQHGWLQGYNAQAAVDANQVVIACSVTNEGNDSPQFLPMMQAVAANLEEVGADASGSVLLADAGYWSEVNATAPGPDRLIATMKSHRQREMSRSLGTTEGPPPPGASAADAMEHRLRTHEGASTYAARSHTVEPVFAGHKDNRGFRRFSRRGLDAVSSEWSLINTTHNLRKLWRSNPGFVPPLG